MQRPSWLLVRPPGVSEGLLLYLLQPTLTPWEKVVSQVAAAPDLPPVSPSLWPPIA